jgi:peptide deformylase
VSTPKTIEHSPSIVSAGDPVLRNPALPVPPELFGTPELRALADVMVEAMRNAPGVGLAGPQLGVNLRIIVLEDTSERMSHLTDEERAERARRDVPLTVLLNPVLTRVDVDKEEAELFFEGCLSVPGYTALVPRARTVEVTALQLDGTPTSLRASGWPARILQHECDHLDGTLYVDRMLSRSLCTVEQARTRWSGKTLTEIADALRLR